MPGNSIDNDLESHIYRPCQIRRRSSRWRDLDLTRCVSHTLWCTLVFMARTNIDIDEKLVERVMHDYGLRSKREAVDLALRRLVQAATKEETLALQGSGWIGELDDLRGVRNP